MSVFDAADALTSRAMDDYFGDPVVWRPMMARSGGGYVTKPGQNRSWQPDPSRPVRGENQETDPFTAVVVWRPETVDPGSGAVEQNSAASNDVMLDFSVELFRDPDTGIAEYPQPNDRFEVSHPSGKTFTIQSPRVTSDDGTGRVVVYCIAPE